MSKKTLRELLTIYCECHDWDTDDEDLEEVLRDSFTVVWEGDRNEHRWRIEYWVVVEIIDNEDEKRYFKFSTCCGTGDNSWEDAGYEFEGIDSVSEVYPREVTTVEYV